MKKNENPNYILYSGAFKIYSKLKKHVAQYIAPKTSPKYAEILMP